MIPHTYYGLLYRVRRLLRENEGRYFFPLKVARIFNVSRLEAEFALRMLVERKYAFRREDGRYLKAQE